MSVMLPYGLAQLAARAQIQDRIHAWARGVDRRDWKLAASIFHPEGVDDHGIYVGKVDGLIELLKQRHEGISMSVHCFTNIVIEFASETTALAESYGLVWQRYSSGDKATRAAISGGVDASDAPFDMVMAVRYVDEFGFRAGTWRIDRRTTVFESTMRYEVPSNAPKMAPTWTLGRRDHTDTVMLLRERLGLSA